MTVEFVSNTSAILEKILKGAPQSEVAEILEQLKKDSSLFEGNLDFEKLVLNLHALIRAGHSGGLTERGLNFLIDTTHDLSSTLGLQELLLKIVARARNLVGANIAWLTLFDADGGIFRTVAAEGHLLPTTAEMTTSSEYGVVSLVMRTKSFFDTQDYLNDTRFVQSPVLVA